MNIARVMVCCTLLLSASCFSQTASGQDLPGVASVSAYDGAMFSNPYGSRYGFREDIGDGRGWDDGSHTFFFRQPFSVVPDQWVVFVEGRGFVPYTGDFGANGGGGIRYLDGSGTIWGVNAWFDHDISSTRANQHFRNYNQVGAGFEALGPYLDFRANVYLPFEDDPAVVNSSFRGLGYSGYSLVGVFNRQIETAMKGGDFEIGGNVIEGLANWGIRPYVGAYYYEGEGENVATGVKARLEALITQDFALEANVTDDRLWGTHVAMAATFTWGSGQSPRWFTRQRQVDRLYSQVERSYRIANHRQIVEEVEQAIDPNTGDPILVFHIDNTAAPGGDGSNVAPLNFLPNSVPAGFDIIFVHRGNGTTTGQNGGINLFDDQRLLGEGALHPVNTQFGVLPLPGTPGPFPSISNLAGAAVTLANRNEVAGFNIINSAGAGIAGNNVTDFALRDLNINGNTQGISLANAMGVGSVFRTTMDSNVNGGLIINNVSANDLTLTLESVQINNSANGPAFELTANDSNILALVTNSVFNTSRDAMHLEGANGSNVTVVSTTSRYTNSVGDGITNGNGISATADGSTVSVTSFGDQITNNVNHGVTTSVLNNGVMNFNFLGQTGINLNGSNGFNSVVNMGTLNLSATGNTTFNGNGGTGVQIVLNNASAANVGFDTIQAVANAGHGVGFIADNSNINLSITNSSLNNNALNGLSTVLANGSVYNAFLFNNVTSFNQNGLNGILTRADDSTINQFVMVNNNANGNGISGVRFELNNSFLLDGRFQGNRMINNASYGMSYFAFNSVVNANVGGLIPELGNVFQGNGDAGIGYYSSGTPAIASFVFMGNNVFSDQLQGPNPAANGEGAIFDLRNTGTLNLIADRNLFEGNASHGIQVSQLNNSTVNFIASNNTFGFPLIPVAGVQGNGGDGIHLERFNDAMLNADITGNVFNGNAGDGFELFAVGGGLAPLDLLIANNIISNNNRGIFMTGQADVDILANIANNSITDNRGDGILWIAAEAVDMHGLWNDNTIARNGGDGIDLGGNAGAGADELQILRNTIVDNAGDGIRIGVNTSSGGNTVSINDSLIARNGGFGLQMDNDLAFNLINIRNTDIEQNAAGGITILNTLGSTLTMNIDNSRIRFNGGRGINLFNFEPGVFSADATIQITDSQVVGNNGEGIFIDNRATGFLSGPTSTLVALNNTISGNGNLTTVGGIVLASSTTNSGAVFADIENNFFSGNFGDDFVTLAYRAQAGDPADTIADPLARLDLQFRGNQGNSISVLNFTNVNSAAFAASFPGLAAITDQTWFDNSSTVKSPVPPFATATRQRNAVRQVLGFPGLGDSTFRVENDVIGSNAFPDINEFSGFVGMPGANELGELGYEWLFVPVGTLFP